MDTEHKFSPGERVYVRNASAQDRVGTVENFFGNRIYTVNVDGIKTWAYEVELRPIPIEELLKISIAQAKAKRQPGE